MSSKTAIAFNELYGRSSGKSKRLAVHQNIAKTVPTPTPSPTIKISPPTPIKEKGSTSFSGLDASGPSQTEEMAVSKPLVKEWHASLNPNLRNHVVDKL